MWSMGAVHLVQVCSPRIRSVRMVCNTPVVRNTPAELCMIHLQCVTHWRSGMLAPPRGKTGCPAPQKAGLAPPREIDKTRGAQRGKTECRFHE